MRFTIRDLLLLTVIVALGLGWWIDRSRADHKAAEQERQWRSCTLEILQRLASATHDRMTFTTPDGKTFNLGDYSDSEPFNADIGSPPGED